jgi:cyclopropane fatty-acyl-phospholipid synthase-like methyltransferase
VVDSPQLEKLAEVLALKPGDSFVDLGCALGSLTEWAANQTGADGTGIDIAAPALDNARRRVAGNDKLAFIVNDLNAIGLPKNSFDEAFAVDTLYLVDDLQAAVGDIVAPLQPGGRFAAYYSVYRTDKEPDRSLEADDSALAEVLRAHGIAYEVVDFTANARAVWANGCLAADELKQAWTNEEIWRGRDGETNRVLGFHEAGRARRYLYWATV